VCLLRGTDSTISSFVIQVRISLEGVKQTAAAVCVCVVTKLPFVAVQSHLYAA